VLSCSNHPASFRCGVSSPNRWWPDYRRDRNRAAALLSYYQRKAQRQQLELEAAGLRADMAALQTVLLRLESNPEIGATVRPMLQTGVAAADILSQLDML